MKNTPVTKNLVLKFETKTWEIKRNNRRLKQSDMLINKLFSLKMMF